MTHRDLRTAHRNAADRPVHSMDARTENTPEFQSHALDPVVKTMDRVPSMTEQKNQRPQKRSLTLNGHRTSVSLEDDFWIAFREIAAERNMAINALAAEIDSNRTMDGGLASAIRLHILRHYRDRG